MPTFWDEFEEVFELPSKELQNLIEDVDSIRKAGSIVKDFTCGKYGDAVTLTPIFCEVVILYIGEIVYYGLIIFIYYR